MSNYSIIQVSCRRRGLHELADSIEAKKSGESESRASLLLLGPAVTVHAVVVAGPSTPATATPPAAAAPMLLLLPPTAAALLLRSRYCYC